MRTSHVGSYPLEHSLANMVRAYSDTLSLGLSIPPIPQLRSFTDIYLEPLVRDGTLRRVSEGRYAPLNLDNPSFDPGEVEKFLELSGADPRNLRFAVAGPLTLASRVGESEGFHKSMLAKKEVVLSFFTPYVKGIVEWASYKGIGYLFIDEPILGLIVGRRILFNYSERDLISIYEEILSEFKYDTGLHVCGKISPLLSEILVRIPVKYLSHEFHDTRENLGVFERGELEEFGKIISPGVVSARDIEVEPPDEVSSLLKALIERFGGDRVDLVSADCGFRGLLGYENAYETSLMKLKVIVDVASSLE
ncbi:MAG: methionine synthase [Candidatus Korarchaeum sp.]